MTTRASLKVCAGSVTLNRSDGGDTPAEVQPVGATFAWVGDGLEGLTAGVGPGAANPVHQFQALMAGRVQPVAAPTLGMSGTTIKTQSGSSYPWIYPYAIDAAAAQTPDIFVIGTMGANDDLLSTNPGANPASGQTANPFLQDWYDAVNYAHTKFSAYGGSVFVVVATAPSAKAGEATYRSAVWAAMAAHVAAMNASDSKVVFVALDAMLPVTNYSVDSGSSYVHIDERGAYYIANAVKSAIDAEIEAKTPDEIVDMIVAGTYPLMTWSQLDSDTALAGTGGTVTGPGVTGTIATSKAITNTSGATGITVSQVSTSGGRTKTVVSFSGATTPTGGRVLVKDESNFAVTGTPGNSFMAGAIMRASAGFWNFGSDWGGGLYGVWGGPANSLGPSGKAGAGAAQPMATVAFANPYSVYANSTTYSNKRGFALYWPNGATMSGTFELERPFMYKIDERSLHAPTYLGDVASGSGTRLLPTTQAMRPSGTVTNAAGGTVRVEPGLWTPRGLTQADFGARRIYAGGGAGNANIGAGALLATLSGSTWTYAISAGAVSTGVKIYVEVDVNSGIGPTVTARSISSITVG